MHIEVAQFETIIQLLGEMNRNGNVTIITATHDIKMLSASDRIVWVRDGTLAKIEKREDLDIQVGSIEGDAEGGIEASLRGAGEQEEH